MTLGASIWLHLLWLIPALAVVLSWAAARRRRDLERLMSSPLLARELPPDLGRRRAWRATLTLLGLSAVILAAAQPRWGFSWQERPMQGVEILLVLDVSQSMDAQDVEPSRLERARREAADLLDRLPKDRVGLVVFAAGAYPRVPLTLDHDALLGILDDTDTSLLQAQGSNLGGAIEEALLLFGEDNSVDRALVVLSDGENWDESLDRATQAAAAKGVRLYALGIGTEEGAPVPRVGGGFKTDREGKVVITRLNEDSLLRAAQATGGAYTRSVAGATDTRALVADLQGALTRRSEESRREKVWDERFQWPLAAGLGLLLLAALWGDGRAALTMTLLLLALPARADTLSEARKLMAQGQAPQAVELLSQAQVRDPADPQIARALAEALYRAGRYEEAARGFEELAQRAPTEQERREALYNSGNAAYRAGRLNDAVEAWDQVLAQDPEHKAAQHNRDAVMREISARQQTPPPQQGQGQNQSQSGQNQQSQDGQDQQGQQQGQQGQQQGQQGQQQGQPQQGQQQDQPKPGQEDPAQAGQGQQPPQEGQQGSTSDGTRPEDGQDAQALQAGEQGAAQDDPSNSSSSTTSGDTPLGEMSPEEAMRALEGVKEGQPRVVIRGEAQEKDW